MPLLRLLMSTLNWDRRHTISWNATTSWRHGRCPLRRQQDGHAVSTRGTQTLVNGMLRCQCSISDQVQTLQSFVNFSVFFLITVCVKQWNEGVARQQSAPELNASAAVLTTDSKQWLVTTPETGFKVVRAQQPPLTKETLPPHRHLSSLEHPPTYWLFYSQSNDKIWPTWHPIWAGSVKSAHGQRGMPAIHFLLLRNVHD